MKCNRRKPSGDRWIKDSGQYQTKKKKKKKIVFKVEQNCKYNTSEFAITSTSHTICTTKYTIFTTKYTNEKKISRVQNIKLMIINISSHDHRLIFSIGHRIHSYMYDPSIISIVS